MRVFLTVGTHEQAFDRMVTVADTLAESGHDVTIQYGYSRRPASARGFDFSDARELSTLFDAADAVVTHAGPATVLQALEAGRLPIVFPRLRRYAEHVDDHQLAFARHLERQGLARFAASEAEAIEQVSGGPHVSDMLAERKARVTSNRVSLAGSLDSWLYSRRGG